MSKENKKAGSGEKKGTLGRWFSRLFFPNKEMDIYAEEALQRASSPSHWLLSLLYC